MKKNNNLNFIMNYSEVSCTFCLVSLTLLKDISPSSSLIKPFEYLLGNYKNMLIMLITN